MRTLDQSPMAADPEPLSDEWRRALGTEVFLREHRRIDHVVIPPGCEAEMRARIALFDAKIDDPCYCNLWGALPPDAETAAAYGMLRAAFVVNYLSSCAAGPPNPIANMRDVISKDKRTHPRLRMLAVAALDAIDVAAAESEPKAST